MTKQEYNLAELFNIRMALAHLLDDELLPLVASDFTIEVKELIRKTNTMIDES